LKRQPVGSFAGHLEALISHCLKHDAQRVYINLR
jgi:hypothetical protein